MKKITSLSLVICLIFSLLAIPALAVSSNDVDYSSEIERGYELGFNEFINVELYAENAGKAGYNSLRLLRVGVPEVSYFSRADEKYYYTWYMPLYIYNPLGIDFIYGYDSGTIANIFLEATENVSGSAASFITPGAPLSEENCNDIFFKCYAVGTISSDLSEEYFKADSVVYSINNFYWGVYDIYENCVPINEKIELKGVDFKLDYTQPTWDLSTFLDISEEDVLREYPVDPDGELQIAYLYESSYGTSNYTLYLYLYNPSGVYLKSYVNAYISIGKTYYPFVFQVLKSSDTLIKLKLVDSSDLSDLTEGLYIRDYFIGKLQFEHFVDDKVNYVDMDTRAHFEYSSSSLTDQPKMQFVQEFFILEEWNWSQASAAEIYLDIPDDVEVAFSDNVTASSISTGIYSLDLSSDCFKENEACFYVYLNDDFLILSPYLKYDIVVKIANGSTETLSYNAQGVTYPGVRPQALASDTDENNALYMRSNVVGDVSIKCDRSFYRINSSSSGNNLYQTLMTLGFGLDLSYLEMSDFDYKNDRYVDFIKLSYNQGDMLGLVSTDKDFISKNKLVAYGSSGYAISKGFLASNYRFSTNQHMQVTLSSDIWFGPKIDAASSFVFKEIYDNLEAFHNSTQSVRIVRKGQLKKFRKEKKMNCTIPYRRNGSLFEPLFYEEEINLDYSKFKFCKVYHDGSHHVAVPVFTSKKRGERTRLPIDDAFDEAFQLAFEERVPKSRLCLWISDVIKKTYPEQEDVTSFVEKKLANKAHAAYARRKRFKRKAYLNEWNYFVTITYDDKLCSEAEFKKRLKRTLANFAYRRNWLSMGVFERAPDTNRLHFHALMFIPEGQMPGELREERSYSRKYSRMQTTHINTFFEKSFGRNDFEALDLDKFALAKTIDYILKYMEKTGEQVIYSRHIPTELATVIANEDVAAEFVDYVAKMVLFDDVVDIRKYYMPKSKYVPLSKAQIYLRN